MKRTKRIPENADKLLDFKADSSTIKKSAANSIILKLIFKMKGIITMPIITYYLVPEELGVFRIIMLGATMLTPVFCLNLIDGPGIFFVQEKSKENIRSMYNTMVNGVVLFALVFSVIFWFAMDRYGGDYRQYTQLVLAVILAKLVFHTLSVILIFFQKTSMLVRRNLYKDIIATAGSVLLVIAGFSYNGMLLAEISSCVIIGLSIYHFTRHQLPYKVHIDIRVLRKFLVFSVPLLPVFFFSWIMESLDTYFITYFKGLDDVGKYGVVYSISSLMLVLTFALNLFWFPVSARLWVEDRKRYQQMFRMIFSGFTLVLLTGVLLFELNSRAIIQILVRNTEYWDAYTVMGIIAFALSMRVLVTLLTAPLYSNKNTKMILFSYFTGSLANCVLNYMLIPEYGISGAAVSTAISYFLIVFVMTYQNYKTCNFRFIEKRLVFICALFVMLWFGMYELRSYFGTYQVLLVNLPFVLAAGGAVYWFYLNQKEKELLSSSIEQLKTRFSS